MAYCVASDVQSEFKNLRLSTDTLVTTSDVTGFIAQADAMINSYVRQRYTLPVSDAEALDLLKLFSVSLVAQRVKSILASKNGSTNDRANQETRGGTLSTSDVMKMLAQIAKGEMALGGELTALPGGPFKSYNVSNGVEPVFEKDTKQW